ncbi:MAG: hypothetical protein COW19_11230 [Zetaproteobacteria bacterium CG12_big_fil_rev_8_21_14_0_65_55_1124]|nr:MAG: hypothetical protein COT53_08525 [Zetaproteobacteria bacterium CG08_land_8_20_14_0_20_55_17]PIW41852.1 MAG: hypothetical protein COW19_11230 [Zetaproteobacteria bacterium CG12_big_fil_rev_8_21_14_0_65_55_1124]PIY53463.1 MAG: hypothetical protein COZ01_03780 [Zetaproteobacteria bacterium CG_4_10_14_0_8_um_filter_55_43]PIZ39483.1 MAG: hypothetical protein COY36_02850 [Zetaproteobacteria bacterium CG_4_10_14_0_2_um_filter_55_20]PJB81692.1 MAG: hypothetical protein CO089_03495 [Zetaproteoba
MEELMAVRPKAKSPKKPKGKDEVTSEPSDSMFPDESGDSSELETQRSANTPVASSATEQKPKPASTLDDIEDLFVEEESEASSGGGKDDAKTLLKSGKTEGTIAASGLDVEAVENDAASELVDDMEDEEKAPDIFNTTSDDSLNPNEEGETSEGDIAESDAPDQQDKALTKVNAVEADVEASEQEESKASDQSIDKDSIEEKSTAPERRESMDMESSTEHAATTVAKDDVAEHASKKHAESSTKHRSGDSTHKPASLAVEKPRMGMGVIVGLIGIIAAIGAIGMNIGMSGRIAQLEAQLASGVPSSGASYQGAEIASIKQQLDALSGQFSAHMSQIAQVNPDGPASELTQTELPVQTETLVEPAAQSVAAIQTETATVVAAKDNLEARRKIEEPMAGGESAVSNFVQKTGRQSQTTQATVPDSRMTNSGGSSGMGSGKQVEASVPEDSQAKASAAPQQAAQEAGGQATAPASKQLSQDWVMKLRLFFGSGHRGVSKAMQRKIDEFAKTLSPTAKVRVAGHSDGEPVGGYAGNTHEPSHALDSNMAVSQERATAVVRALILAGVGFERIETGAFGSSNPIASNDTAEGRAKNRRVEIFINE